MPLTLTSPTNTTIDEYVIPTFGVQLDRETGAVVIDYQRLAGGVFIDVKYVTGTAAGLLAATGATSKAKSYAYLQTLTGQAGTVS